MMMLNPGVRKAILFGAWFVWILGLTALRKQRLEKAVKVDPRARWGIGLVMAGYFIVCVHSPEFWNSDFDLGHALAGAVFALVAIVVFRNAVANLGRQWRFDAGLNQDHELVQTGVYRFVRHPIYASMLGMLLADVCWAGTLPGWPIGLVLFLIGTEIRIRVEDQLLRQRFGERFSQWQTSVPAYLPLIR